MSLAAQISIISSKYSSQTVIDPGKSVISSYDLNNYFADHADTYLNTPSVSDPWDSTSIHAGIVDMLEQHGIPTWNGYRYWMAHTPFPPNHPVNPSQGENPEILVSNDGVTWIEPPGITNPIELTPTGVGYNADPFLWFSDDTLYCFYRRAQLRVYARSSTDGITWSDRIEVYNFFTNPDYAISPQIVKIGAIYWMYGVASVGEGGGVKRMPSSSLLGPYDHTQVENITFVDSDVFTDNYLEPLIEEWQFSLKMYQGKLYMGMYYINGNSNRKALYILVSEDYTEFTQIRYPVLSMYYDYVLNHDDGNFAWDMGHYTPEILPFKENGVFKIHLWYTGYRKETSGKTFYYQAYSVIEPKTTGLELSDGNSIAYSRIQQLAAANNLNGYIFGDDCTRSNEILNLSSSGVAWNVTEGQFSIYNNYIVNSMNAIPATGFSTLRIDSVPADFEIIFQWLYVTKGVGSDTYPLFYPVMGSVDGDLRMFSGLNSTVPLWIWNGVYNKIRACSRWFLPTELVEYKIRMVSNLFTLWINGCKMYSHQFVVGDFADLAEMNSILGGGQIGWRFPANSDDQIKNVTLRDLT